MRRESVTVVGLAGQVTDSLLAALSRSGNLSVARAPAAAPGQPLAADGSAHRRGWEPGAQAMREAARRRSTFVIVADDPLADVAATWDAMWEPAAPAGAPAEFEARAAEALAAWREKQFELPDYYLVAAQAQPGGAGPDFYLGPLQARGGSPLLPRRADGAADGWLELIS